MKAHCSCNYFKSVRFVSVDLSTSIALSDILIEIIFKRKTQESSHIHQGLGAKYIILLSKNTPGRKQMKKNTLLSILSVASE